MPTQAQIVNRILRGQLLQANTTKGYVAQEGIGNLFNFWDKVVYISGLVEGLSNQYAIGDYVSTTTLNIYNKLGGILGMQYIDGATLDPNAQPIGQIISIDVPVVLGYNQGQIPFISTEISPAVELLNYHEQYYPLYGNNPVLGLYDDQGSALFVGDEQTAPQVLRTVPSNPTSDIISILWDLPPITDMTTTGYVQISGASPVQSGGSGSSGTISLSFTQASLLGNDDDGWYLPLTLPTNRVPVYLSSNGITLPVAYDTNFSPARLTGFANNETQTIIVKVI